MSDDMDAANEPDDEVDPTTAGKMTFTGEGNIILEVGFHSEISEGGIYIVMSIEGQPKSLGLRDRQDMIISLSSEQAGTLLRFLTFALDVE